MRLIDSRLANTSNSGSSYSGSESSTSTELVKPQAIVVQSTPIDYVTPVPNLPQEEVDKRLAEAARVDVTQRNINVRRTKSANLDEQSSSVSASTSHEKSFNMTPRKDDDDDDEGEDTESEDEDKAVERLQSALRGSTNGLQSPRKKVVDRAMRHKQQTTIMQSFLNGDRCNYSFTELHKCVWTGLNDSLREQFWVVQSVPNESAVTPETIDELLARARMPATVYKQILTDLYRTMPEAAHANSFFINTLYRGLLAHAVLRPDVGYMQGMNFLWGMIILCVTNPQRQLLVAEHLLRIVLPYYFTTDQIVGAAIDAIVLRYYLQRRCTNLEQRMNSKFQGDMRSFLLCVTSSWFTRLFIGKMRLSNCKRLWDMIMLRGAVVLFEFALRIFIYSHKHKWLDNSAAWPELMLKIEARLIEMPNIDPILNTHIPNGHLILEDFNARRRVATRVVFSDLRNNVPIIEAGTQ